MLLEGWNHVPDGCIASFDVVGAPAWLRGLVRIPLLDRFAYPLLVRGGFGFLTVDDLNRFDEASARRLGWQVRPSGYIAPESRARLAKRKPPAG